MERNDRIITLMRDLNSILIENEQLKRENARLNNIIKQHDEWLHERISEPHKEIGDIIKMSLNLKTK